jgi:hypothetical protein
VTIAQSAWLSTRPDVPATRVRQVNIAALGSNAPELIRGAECHTAPMRGVRREAIATLRAATWVRSLRVELRDLTDADHQCSDGKRGGDGAHGISRKDGRAIVCQASPTGKACGPCVAYRASASQAAKYRSSSV